MAAIDAELPNTPQMNASTSLARQSRKLPPSFTHGVRGCNPTPTHGCVLTSPGFAKLQDVERRTTQGLYVKICVWSCSTSHLRCVALIGVCKGASCGKTRERLYVVISVWRCSVTVRCCLHTTGVCECRTSSMTTERLSLRRNLCSDRSRAREV